MLYNTNLKYINIKPVKNPLYSLDLVTVNVMIEEETSNEKQNL